MRARGMRPNPFPSPEDGLGTRLRPYQQKLEVKR
jgi:hypothetical protein